jgi:hypothetical protein
MPKSEWSVDVPTPVIRLHLLTIRPSRQVRPDILPPILGNLPDLREPDLERAHECQRVAPADDHVHGKVPEAVDCRVLDDEPTDDRPLERLAGSESVEYGNSIFCNELILQCANDSVDNDTIDDHDCERSHC